MRNLLKPGKYNQSARPGYWRPGGIYGKPDQLTFVRSGGSATDPSRWPVNGSTRKHSVLEAQNRFRRELLRIRCGTGSLQRDDAPAASFGIKARSVSGRIKFGSRVSISDSVPTMIRIALAFWRRGFPFMLFISPIHATNPNQANRMGQSCASRSFLTHKRPHSVLPSQSILVMRKIPSEGQTGSRSQAALNAGITYGEKIEIFGPCLSHT